MSDEFIEDADRKRLLLAVLHHAMDDLVKHAHPKYRRKKYLEEAYQQALDMFFDSSYRMMRIQDDDGSDMDLKTLLNVCIDTDLVDPDQLRTYLINETVRHWDEKHINTVFIPDSFVIEGHPYRVFHRESSEYEVDFNEKILYINKDDTDSENQETFVAAVIEIILYHTELSVSHRTMRGFAKAFFRTLKVNSCFCGGEVQAPKFKTI